MAKSILYDFPNYRVTPDGEVWNIKRNKRMKPNHNHRGYWQVKLYNGKYKSFLIHRLVASEYLLQPNGFAVVNHLDGDKKNNLVSNLEWCDNQLNKDHAMRQGNFKSKLAPKDIKDIRDKYRDDSMSCGVLAAAYKVSRMMIYRIVTYKSWKHLP